MFCHIINVGDKIVKTIWCSCMIIRCDQDWNWAGRYLGNEIVCVLNLLPHNRLDQTIICGMH